MFFLNIKSTIKDVQSQGKCKTNFELFSNISFASWSASTLPAVFYISTLSVSVNTFAKSGLNFSRWLKLCPTNNFARPKICLISYLVYNEENYNTLLNTLSNKNSWKESSVFQNLLRQSFFIFLNFECKDKLIKYFLSLLVN